MEIPDLKMQYQYYPKDALLYYLMLQQSGAFVLGSLLMSNFA